jgi:hypothetical protein
VLAKTNAILQDAPWVEANQIGGHKISRRTGLPSGTWRQISQGVTVEKSKKKQLTETIGLLEATNEIDEALIEMQPNPSAYRAGEDKAFIEGLSQSVASAVIYGDAVTDPEKFNGFAARISDLSSVDGAGIANVIGTGGTGSDLSSIWIVQWGVGKCYMVYPRGSKAGIEVVDHGRVRVTDSNSKPYWAWSTQFKVKTGLVLEDDRCLQRIANIETAGSSNIFDEDDIITALNRLPFNGDGAVIYVNRTIKTQMDIAAKDKTNVNYSSAEVWGKPTLTFQGVPVRRVDAILDTESALA